MIVACRFATFLQRTSRNIFRPVLVGVLEGKKKEEEEEIIVVQNIPHYNLIFLFSFFKYVLIIVQIDSFHYSRAKA